MKTPKRLVFLLAIAVLGISSASADTVRGYLRSNGTYVAPYYRTPANGTPYDNLSYHGYPSQQPGYVSPRSNSYGSAVTMPRFESSVPSFPTSRSTFGTGLQTLPNLGDSRQSWGSSLLE